MRASVQRGQSPRSSWLHLLWMRSVHLDTSRLGAFLSSHGGSFYDLNLGPLFRCVMYFSANSYNQRNISFDVHEIMNTKDERYRAQTQSRKTYRKSLNFTSI